MAPTRRSRQYRTPPFLCSEGAESVWLTGDLTTDELDQIGPDATPESRPAWTREEYRAQMEARGVADCQDGTGLGIDGFLELAEAYGVLEKRPNTLGVVGGYSLPAPDSATFTSLAIPAAREATR